MKKIIIHGAALVGMFLVLASVANAQIPSGVPITLGEISNIIRLLANFLIGVSLVIAVIAMIWAGITYMAAGDDSTKVGAARQRLISALIGALIVLGVGVIMQTLAAIVSRSFFS